MKKTTHEAVLAALIPAAERAEFDQRVQALVIGNGVRAAREDSQNPKVTQESDLPTRTGLAKNA